MPARSIAILTAALLAGYSLGCAASQAPPTSITLPRPDDASLDQPPTSGVPASAYLGERARCIDRELARRGLNPYGDPQGTTYAGGSPLYNEVTGTTVDRYDFVVQRHREIGAACSTVPGSPVR